jgi:hypothetical protein
MALVLTQHPVETSTRQYLLEKERPARKADNLTATCKPTVQRQASMACYRDICTFYAGDVRTSQETRS